MEALTRDLAERVSEVRRLQAQLKIEVKRRELVQSALMRSHKLEALGHLTSGVAHDFNNVIMAIAGGFELIQRRTSDERTLAIAQHGVKAAERGAAMIKQLLNFASQHQTAPVAVDVCRLLADAEPLLRRAAGSKIELSIDCPDDLPPTKLDSGQLETALINLAVNARDAMASGRLAIVASRCEAGDPAHPRELCDVDAIAVSVSDDGPGIEPEILQRVLEPFFTTKPVGKGTGLGLAMVQGFVERAGGALRLQSRVGAGTSITLFLPVAAIEEVVAPAVLAGKPPTLGLGDGGTVLLVDDNGEVRAIVREQLVELGFEVLEAASAMAALTLLRASERINLLLSDVDMPEIDGHGLAARVRREQPGLPLVLMTGNVGCPRLEGEIVIGKPFSTEALASCLSDAIGDSDSKAASSADWLKRIHRRIRSEAFRRVFARWCDCKGLRAVPDLRDFALGDDEADGSVLVGVDMGTVPIGFEILEIGAALLARCDRRGPADLDVMGDDTLGSQREAYRLCAMSGKPSYEHARFELDDGAPAVFERLLLPFSETESHVTRLIAVVTVETTLSRP